MNGDDLLYFFFISTPAIIILSIAGNIFLYVLLPHSYNCCASVFSRDRIFQLVASIAVKPLMISQYF